METNDYIVISIKNKHYTKIYHPKTAELGNKICNLLTEHGYIWMLGKAFVNALKVSYEASLKTELPID